MARKHFRFVTAFSIGFLLIHNECVREDIAIRQKRQAGKRLWLPFRRFGILRPDSENGTRVLRVQGVRRAPRDINPIYKWLHGCVQCVCIWGGYWRRVGAGAWRWGVRGRVGGGIPSRLAELIPILGLDGFSCPPSFKLNRKYRIHLLFSRANAAHERIIALYKNDHHQ